MKERRRSPRKATRLRGRVYIMSRDYLRCVVRDISYEGARLDLDDPVEILDLIKLYIPTKNQVAYGHVSWCHGNKIGIAFSKIVPAGKKRSDQRAPEKSAVTLRV
jgi:hypothetical protein